MQRADVLIVGAGHAGAQTAIALANAKFAGSVALLSDEPELPYERPPLSKDYLAGARSFEHLLIRTPNFWHERGISIFTGERVIGVEPDTHCVKTANGGFEYAALVWASGGRPRLLSCAGADLSGVHTVRTRADVDRMIAEIPEVRNVVVIGGGYIGLEAASVLRKLGKKITVLEALPRVLARVAGEEISRFYEAEHRAHGVDLRTGVTVACIEGTNGKASGVRLASGEFLAAEMVIVGIGIVPGVDALADAGAVCGNGVHIDEFCRTTLPDIYAVGDCAAHINGFAGGARIRLESVQNANEQGATCAKALCGRAAPYNSVPWFWSDQYDLKLQTIGLSSGYDAAITRGDPATRSFSVAYMKGDHIVALDCVNLARDYVQGRKLITDRRPIDKAKLADGNVELKSL